MRTRTSTPSGQDSEASARCAATAAASRRLPCESDEEGVALGMDLATVVFVERRAQQALMLGEHLGVAATEPRQQSRRTLDVGEHEGDGATRKLRHNAQLRRITAACQGLPAVLASSRTRIVSRKSPAALRHPLFDGSGTPNRRDRRLGHYRDGRVSTAMRPTRRTCGALPQRGTCERLGSRATGARCGRAPVVSRREVGLGPDARFRSVTGSRAWVRV